MKEGGGSDEKIRREGSENFPVTPRTFLNAIALTHIDLVTQKQVLRSLLLSYQKKVWLALAHSSLLQNCKLLCNKA